MLTEVSEYRLSTSGKRGETDLEQATLTETLNSNRYENRADTRASQAAGPKGPLHRGGAARKPTPLAKARTGRCEAAVAPK